jgi:hypothetical protein
MDEEEFNMEEAEFNMIDPCREQIIERIGMAQDNYTRAITELRDEKDRCDADPTHVWRINSEQEGGKRKRRGHPAGLRKRKTRGRRGGRRKTRRKRGGMTVNEVEAARREGRKVRYNCWRNRYQYLVTIAGDVEDGRVDVRFDNPPHYSLHSARLDLLTEEQEGGKLRGHPAGPGKTRRKRGGMTVPEAEAALVNQIPVRYSEYPDYDAYIRGIADGAATIRIYDGVGAYGHFTDTVEINDLTEVQEVQEGGKRRRRPAGPRKTRRKRGGTKSPQQIKKEAVAREREFRKEANKAAFEFFKDYSGKRFPKSPKYQPKVTERGGKKKRKTRRKRH